jgi:nitroreductase
MPLTLNALDTRRSVPTRQLAAPGPDHAQLLRILRTAVRVPDHGKRVPFRFLRITGDARHALADTVALRACEREPDTDPAVIEKLRTRYTVPPLTLAVVAKLGPDEKIPASERAACAACVCFLLLQATQAEGYGAQWTTGWLAYDRPFLERVLGLAADEQLAGTIAIGTPQLIVPERERPDPAALLADWTPSR